MTETDATAAARNAALLNLAQYVVAVDGTKVVTAEAQKVFGLVQHVASLILLDTLRDYQYTHMEGERDPTPIIQKRKNKHRDLPGLEPSLE